MAQTLVPEPVRPSDGAGLEDRATRARSRTGAWIALPPAVYLVLLFALPLVIVFIYSFATRGSTGQTILADWNVTAYTRLFNPLVREIAVRSIGYALLTTAICLVVSYPFAR